MHRDINPCPTGGGHIDSAMNKFPRFPSFPRNKTHIVPHVPLNPRICIPSSLVELSHVWSLENFPDLVPSESYTSRCPICKLCMSQLWHSKRSLVEHEILDLESLDGEQRYFTIAPNNSLWLVTGKWTNRNAWPIIDRALGAYITEAGHVIRNPNLRLKDSKTSAMNLQGTFTRSFISAGYRKKRNSISIGGWAISNQELGVLWNSNSLCV